MSSPRCAPLVVDIPGYPRHRNRSLRHLRIQNPEYGIQICGMFVFAAIWLRPGCDERLPARVLLSLRLNFWTSASGARRAASQTGRQAGSAAGFSVALSPQSSASPRLRSCVLAFLRSCVLFFARFLRTLLILQGLLFLFSVSESDALARRGEGLLARHLFMAIAIAIRGGGVVEVVEDNEMSCGLRELRMYTVYAGTVRTSERQNRHPSLPRS